MGEAEFCLHPCSTDPRESLACPASNSFYNGTNKLINYKQVIVGLKDKYE